MQFHLLPISLLLSVAAAQTTETFTSKPSTSTACAGQGVLDSCIGSTKAIVANCGPTDYGCLCQKWDDVLTCYTRSGCLDDPTQSVAQNSKDTYCANASIYSSSTTTAISRAVTSASASTTDAPTTTGATTPQTTGGNGGVRAASSSSSGGAAAPTQVGNGAEKGVVGIGGVVVGLMGAMLL